MSPLPRAKGDGKVTRGFAILACSHLGVCAVEDRCQTEDLLGPTAVLYNIARVFANLPHFETPCRQFTSGSQIVANLPPKRDKRLVCNYGKASLLRVLAPTGTLSYGYSLLREHGSV